MKNKYLLLIAAALFFIQPVSGETLRKVQAYADRGDSAYQFKMGLWLYTGYKIEKDCTRAAYYFELAAGQNHIEALFLLGFMCFYGEEIEKDIAKGLALLERAAEMDHVEAQFDLGYIYYMGIETAVDRDRGKYWMGKAADNGYAKAVELLHNLNE